MMNLSQLKQIFVDKGCYELYIKPLAENDNSKNQVYFGPGFDALNIFPNNGIFPDSNPKNPIFKAQVSFSWIMADGSLSVAPHAQIILYPQYPEVRFSGFLQGCKNAPSDLMRSRQKGRILFLGVTKDRRIIGYVVDSESIIANEYNANSTTSMIGVFYQLNLTHDSKSSLITELRRIHQLGWIKSKQLALDGTINPCNAPQCGGYTLEAELGIPKNSYSEPDFMGWEVKQHNVKHLNKPDVGVITLMTPEPNGGVYKDEGVETFIRRFGYRDKMGRPDRMNFGGVHKVEKKHPTTSLTMKIIGYDATTEKITNTDGKIALMDDDENIAASWDFAGLMEHWTRKHSRAVYVPSVCIDKPFRQYMYGNIVHLGIQTDFLHLVKSMQQGLVYYDPGIKLEKMSSEKPELKRRSQFRINFKNIHNLYHKMEKVNI